MNVPEFSGSLRPPPPNKYLRLGPGDGLYLSRNSVRTDNTTIISHLQWLADAVRYAYMYRACSLLLFRSKWSTWMLFLSVRWRGESLLIYYIDCLLHSSDRRPVSNHMSFAPTPFSKSSLQGLQRWCLTSFSLETKELVGSQAAREISKRYIC
jgi:hypothetical protein